MRVHRQDEVGHRVLLEVIGAILDLLVKLAPDEDLHAHLDAAAQRRAQALKDEADRVAFGAP